MFKGIRSFYRRLVPDNVRAPWGFIGYLALIALTAAMMATSAHADTPPRRILPAPVTIQVGSNVIGYFSEDGGTSYAGMISNGYVPGSFGVDGGSTFNAISARGPVHIDAGFFADRGLDYAFIQGALTADGGAVFNQGVVVTGATTLNGGLDTTGATTANTLDNLWSKSRVTADGGLFEFGNARVIADLTLSAASIKLRGHVTETDGGAALAFTQADGGAVTFGAAPECNCTSHKVTAEAVSCVGTTTVLTIAGTINTDSVISYNCEGAK